VVARGAIIVCVTYLHALLIDLDGVLYAEDETIAGAQQAVQRLRSSGLALRFVTNTTTHPRRGILERLHRRGFARHAHRRGRIDRGRPGPDERDVSPAGGMTRAGRQPYDR
jgi:hypothetical protein